MVINKTAKAEMFMGFGKYSSQYHYKKQAKAEG